MAKGKKTFIFYSDWINMIKEMPNEDAGILLKHILEYVNDEDPVTDNLLVKMAFGHMKPMLKADLDKWDNIREKRKEAGAKGGKANAKQKQANAKQVEAVNDNVNVILLEKETKEQEETFNKFWNYYDKKRNKEKTKKIFLKLNDDELELIRVNLPRYLESTPDKQYRKDPDVYLRNKCWNDEVIKPKPIKIDRL